MDINAQMLFSDTSVADVFIREYLPHMDGDCVKVYMYCVFLSKSGDATLDAISRSLGMPSDKLKGKIEQLQNLNLVTLRGMKISLVDIKQLELLKYYRPKTALEPEVINSGKRNSARNGAVKHISDRFFAGQMGAVWYCEIDNWFEQYSFDDDVMVMLFQHCANMLSQKGSPLNTNYVGTVAASWNKKGIKTSVDLEKHLEEYEKYKGVKKNVVTKLRISGNLNVYEEKLIEKWFFDYKYTFDIIELALKKSINVRNPSLVTYDKFITEWFSHGLRGKEAILQYEEEKKLKYAEKYSQSKGTGGALQKKYEDQRTYDDKFFDSLEKKVGG